jgi:chemotaxis protein CheX
MRVEFINPFVSAAYIVFESMLQMTPEKGQLRLQPSPLQGKEINTVIGVTGEVIGQVIYCMDSATALKFASIMLMGLPVTEVDEIVKSAVNELGNMITGNAATGLGENGFSCNLTPPTMFMGKDVVVSTKDLQILVIPLITPYGEITINIALRSVDK